MRPYKKVFTNAKFTTKSPNDFTIDSRLKRLTIGARTGNSRTAMLGKVIEQGKSSNILDYDVLCDVDYPHVVGIFGSRGSGKSFDLGVLLEGIFANDVAAQKRDAGIVFDVQDQFWTLAYRPDEDIPEDKSQLDVLNQWGLERTAISNVQNWIPAASDTVAPNARNFSLEPTQLSEADWLCALELERYSPMGQALISLLENLGPSEPRRLAENCNSSTVRDFQSGTLDGLRWRLQGFSRTEIVGDVGLSIDELLQADALNVILMRNLSESVRALIVGVVSRLVANKLGRIQQARKVAVRTKNSDIGSEGTITNRLWMFLDEAHVLIPADATTAATEPLIDYVKRGRDAGLSLIFATQQPSAVNSKLMSQVDMTITHTLGFEADVSAAVARMPTRTKVDYEANDRAVSSSGDLIRSLAPGEAIIADSASGRIFAAKIRPRQSAHGGGTPG